MNHLLKTPFGWCGLIFDNDKIREIVLPSPDKQRVLQRLHSRCYKTNSTKLRQGDSATEFLNDLKRYFNGEKVDFNNMARYITDLTRSSNFERAVYKTLMTVPYGQVRTYQWVAQKAGRPGASRAVGNALAKNPLPIIIPCHRVVKSNGSLGGFSAIGGTELKKKLLVLENAIPKEFGMANERY